MKIAAFDIGGTAVKYALFYGDPKLFTQTNYNGTSYMDSFGSFPTQGEKGAKDLLERIKDKFYEIAPFGLASLSICTRGQVDSDTGMVLYDPPEIISGYSGYNIKEHLSELGVSVHVENDANAAAYAEYSLLKSEEIVGTPDPFCFLTFGTGLGCSIIIDGKIYRGANSSSGEAGMMFKNGKHWEDFVSAKALLDGASRFDSSIKDGRTLVKKLEDNPSRDLSSLLEDWSKEAGEWTSSIIHLLDPAVLVLGGGIMESETIFYSVKEKTKEFLAPGFNVDIRPASLGNKAGLYGAWLLASEE